MPDNTPARPTDRAEDCRGTRQEALLSGGWVEKVALLMGMPSVFTVDRTSPHKGRLGTLPANGLRGSWGGALRLRRCAAGETV